MLPGEPGPHSRPRELVLIRHAQSLPDYDVPADRWRLSPGGREQALALAREPFWRQIRTLHSSDEPKAVQTAEPAARRHGLSLRAVPALREVRRPAGRLPGWEEAVRDYLTGTRGPESWESCAEADWRMAAAVARILSEHPAGDVAIVSHGTVLALYACRLLGLEDRFAFWTTIPFAGWARVDPAARRLIRGFSIPPPR
jgi:broad specificity phosphatase PhoE